MKTNNQLEELLTKAFENEKYIVPFFKEFVESKLFILPQEPLPVDEEGKLNGKKLRVLPYRLEKVSLFPVFTSLEILTQYLKGEERKYLAIPAKVLIENFGNTHWILNPESHLAKLITVDDLKTLQSGFSEEPKEVELLPPGAEVYVKKLEVLPDEFTNDLSNQVFKHCPEVKMAQIGLMNEKEDHESYEIVVSIRSSKEIDKVLPKLQRVYNQYASQVGSVAFIQLDDTDFSKSLSENSTVFYQRKKGFFEKLLGA